MLFHILNATYILYLLEWIMNRCDWLHAHVTFFQTDVHTPVSVYAERLRFQSYNEEYSHALLDHDTVSVKLLLSVEAYPNAHFKVLVSFVAKD